MLLAIMLFLLIACTAFSFWSIKEGLISDLSYFSVLQVVLGAGSLILLTKTVPYTMIAVLASFIFGACMQKTLKKIAIELGRLCAKAYFRAKLGPMSK